MHERSQSVGVREGGRLLCPSPIVFAYLAFRLKAFVLLLLFGLASLLGYCPPLIDSCLSFVLLRLMPVADRFLIKLRSKVSEFMVYLRIYARATLLRTVSPT